MRKFTIQDSPDSSDSIPTRLIGRQPILDGGLNVYGYEMLFRSSHANVFSGDAEDASRDVVDHCLLLMPNAGREAFFINCTRNALMTGIVRWTDQDKVAIAPDMFIKIAEQRGFVNKIAEFVVRRVLGDFARYLEANPEFRINVNVAASDLTDPNFERMLEDYLRDAHVSPQSLGIERTEGATAQYEEAIKAIAQLRQRGHKVYIDDFGTGYSSLAYLKDLAVDGIKIDRAFTRTIGTDSVTAGILHQILAMAEVLKLSVVAEGVETEAQSAYYDNSSGPVTGMAVRFSPTGWRFSGRMAEGRGRGNCIAWRSDAAAEGIENVVYV